MDFTIKKFANLAEMISLVADPILREKLLSKAKALEDDYLKDQLTIKNLLDAQSNNESKKIQERRREEGPDNGPGDSRWTRTSRFRRWAARAWSRSSRLS